MYMYMVNYKFKMLLIRNLEFRNVENAIHRILRSINHTFYQEICFKFLTCDLYCGCEKRGRFRRFHACVYPRVARPAV